MDINSQIKMSMFSGINNVDKADRLFPSVSDSYRSYIYPLVQATNVELDNTLKLSSRKGKTVLLTGSDIHSLWSDGKNCFYANGATLYRLEDDFVSSTIIYQDPSYSSWNRISFAKANDRTYYTNNQRCGYIIGNTRYDYMAIDKKFKLPLPCGSLIEFFLNCLYTAWDNILYISDPLCDYFDIRVGYKQFESDIKMIRAVDNGIYMSDSNRVWFLRGKGSDEFTLHEADPDPAISFTDVAVSAESIGVKASGTVAIWTSTTGICIGDSNGNVIRETHKNYNFSGYGRGAAFIRNAGNVKHYINSLY
jgi:hypothetical protein